MKKKADAKQFRKKKNKQNVNPNDEQSFNQKLRGLVKKYKGFDPWEREHRSKNSIEKEVCHILDKEGIEHKHRSKRFNVVASGMREAIFEPDIIIPHPRIRNKPILIHVLTRENMDRQIPVIKEFKKQLGLMYYVIIVTHKDKLTKVPPEVHDLLVAAEYVSSLPSRILAQAKNRTS